MPSFRFFLYVARSLSGSGDKFDGVRNDINFVMENVILVLPVYVNPVTYQQTFRTLQPLCCLITYNMIYTQTCFGGWIRVDKGQMTVVCHWQGWFQEAGVFHSGLLCPAAGRLTNRIIVQRGLRSFRVVDDWDMERRQKRVRHYNYIYRLLLSFTLLFFILHPMFYYFVLQSYTLYSIFLLHPYA